MEELDVTRLPRNIEAEQAPLGALLANNKAYEKVSEFLRACLLYTSPSPRDS